MTAFSQASSLGGLARSSKSRSQGGGNAETVRSFHRADRPLRCPVIDRRHGLKEIGGAVIGQAQAKTMGVDRPRLAFSESRQTRAARSI